MITIEKLQRMIEKFGEIELDKLCSWFPYEDKETIKETILQSNNLLYENDIIKVKQNNTYINSDITYDALIKIIDRYNQITKDKYEEKNTNDIEDLKLEAIKTFLLKRNTLELFKQSDIIDVYTQINKKTGNKTYCVISKIFNVQAFNYIDSLFEDETVIIYCINTDFTMDTIKDFYIKDCNEIIKRYIKLYQLEEVNVNVLKMTEKIGDNNCGE